MPRFGRVGVLHRNDVTRVSLSAPRFRRIGAVGNASVVSSFYPWPKGSPMTGDRADGT
jgi:hypothetical protein